MPRASTRGGGDLVAKADSSNPVKALAKVLLPKHDAPTPDDKPVAVASADDAVADDATAAQGDDEESAEAEAPKLVAPAKKVKTVIVSAPKVASAQVVAAYAEPAAAAEPAPTVDPVNTASVPSGWAIQVASSPKQSEAQAVLDKTSKQAPKALADASGFTVAFDKDGVTYYRARFGGFGSKDAAWKACTALKKKKIECYAVQQ